MSSAIVQQLDEALADIDRPASFCVAGSAPTVLPGLAVKGLGPIALPLTAKQAQELKKLCAQAPYGKGEKTLVDTNVRRVWELKPERFALTNPGWQPFLQATLSTVQQGLGLDEQKLECHLYDLLLYEPGSFFLPHRDGEKLNRMVATLVIVLPSKFQGGELIVRHDGQERTLDLGSSAVIPERRIHFAAFYADCEHEIRPLLKGYRLCLVYNLTLKKGKKPRAAPSNAEAVEGIAGILATWTKKAEPRKLAVTLEHQYTQDGLTWEALKGVDRAKADVLLQAAQQAGCQVRLALLTFHEAGSAEGGYESYGGYHGRRGRWYDEYEDEDEDEEEEEDEAGDYEMGEVYETSLTADHWSDSQGNRLMLGGIKFEEDELVDPDALKEVTPEEEFEGYTGNAGMTLDRWYRHGAIVLWPDWRHFEILCDAGSQNASEILKVMVSAWKQSKPKNADLCVECIAYAATLIARWQDNPYSEDFTYPERKDTLLGSLDALDEPSLIQAFLGEVMVRDAAVDPGKSLAEVCRQHGWETFRPELEIIFQKTTSETLERNVRLLEHLCLAKPAKPAGWDELVGSLAEVLVQALLKIDKGREEDDYRAREVKRAAVLAGLAKALLTAEQPELLSRVVSHALGLPKRYPLIAAHVQALTTLQAWLKKNVKKPSPALSQWIAACRAQLEALTVQAPQAPADFRRAAALRCTCRDCNELSKFLKDPGERVYRFPAAENRRRHLQNTIIECHCDLDLKTERQGSPHTLVCTKNTASHQAELKTYHENLKHLATLRSIQASLRR